MKVIIAGSRNISDTTNNRQHLINAINESFFVVTEVVCGMAWGVDNLGRIWAESNGIKVTQFPADWKKYGKGAGIVRNLEMAEYADGLIAVWDGTSRGTANMIQTAKNKGLKIYVYKI